MARSAKFKTRNSPHPIRFRSGPGSSARRSNFRRQIPTPDGTCVRDYIHVSDLAEAHVQGLEYLTGKNSTAINLGTGKGNSILEVLSTIKSVTGREVPSRMAPQGREIRQNWWPIPRVRKSCWVGKLSVRWNKLLLLRGSGLSVPRRKRNRREKQSAIDPASWRQRGRYDSAACIWPELRRSLGRSVHQS